MGAGKAVRICFALEHVKGKGTGLPLSSLSAKPGGRQRNPCAEEVERTKNILLGEEGLFGGGVFLGVGGVWPADSLAEDKGEKKKSASAPVLRREGFQLHGHWFTSRNNQRESLEER